MECKGGVLCVVTINKKEVCLNSCVLKSFVGSMDTCFGLQLPDMELGELQG